MTDIQILTIAMSIAVSVAALLIGNGLSSVAAALRSMKQR